MKVLVTGSDGFVGKNLLVKLAENSIDFVCFSRRHAVDDLVSLLTDIDFVFHLAGVNRPQDPDDFDKQNRELTARLCEAIQKTGRTIPVAFTSSIQAAYDNAYGISKKFAEEALIQLNKAIQSPIYLYRLPNVFGKWAKPNYNSVIATFCHQLVNNEIPIIQTDTTLNLIYINDLVKIIIDLFKNESNETINIAYTDTFKVSEILNILNNFKTKYFLQGQIPKLKSNFEINLFNTFRSYFNLKDHFPIKYKNNIDNRGNFVEITRVEIGGQVSFSSTKSGIIRGNHLHTKKIERFSVIKGQALIKLRKKGTDEVFHYHLNGDTPAYVDMPIWYVHNIENIGIEELYTIFWTNELYDANDPDTYSEIV